MSGESRRIGPDMSPDDIAGFLTEETAVRAALRPTCWLAEVSANIDRPYKSDTVSVIVEVVAKDADAPELAYEQASRFVATKYGAIAGIPAKKPCAVPVRSPTEIPTGTHLSRFPVRFGSSAENLEMSAGRGCEVFLLPFLKPDLIGFIWRLTLHHLAGRALLSAWPQAVHSARQPCSGHRGCLVLARFQLGPPCRIETQLLISRWPLRLGPTRCSRPRFPSRAQQSEILCP